MAEHGKYTEVSPLGDCSGLSFVEMRKKIAGCGVPIPTGLYKKKIIVENNLSFPENLLYEDNAVGKPINLCAKRYTKVNKPLYYYRMNTSSTTHSRNNLKFFDRLITAILFKENCIRLGVYNEFKTEIDNSFLNLYFRGTIMGIYENFDSIPYDKIREIKLHVLKDYGRKRLLLFIKSKSMREKCILSAAMISPRLGKLVLESFRSLSKIKHHL